MSATGLRVFDHTVHVTNIWLRDLMDELDWDDRQRAYQALRAVLHTLRDRLPTAEVLHLGAQMPMLVRGFYFEGWRIKETPSRERSVEQFLDHVSEGCACECDGEAEEIVEAVFAILSERVSEGEIEDVKLALPAGVRKLWPKVSI